MRRRLAVLLQIAATALALSMTGAKAGEWRLETTFGDRTGRYGHNVLGGNEYDGFGVVLRRDGDEPTIYGIVLPADRVVEDVAVRVADMTGDDVPEIVLVESSRSGGAELTVYGGLDDGTLEKIAATPPIGRRNRWLAPAGIADLDGDGQNDVAYVETPHIGGTLRVWTMRDGALVEIARAPGFSNHRIGEDWITGGVRDCGGGPELVLPNFDWSRLMAVELRGSALAAREIGEETTRGAVDLALACQD